MSKPKHPDQYPIETQNWNNSFRGFPANLPVLDLHERITKIEKRLLILDPNFELHDKYPSLKEAYEQYKIIERLITNEQT